MNRTTITLPEELDAALRREARRCRVSISQIAREAIEAHLGLSKRRKVPFAGLVRSGYQTTARNFDGILEAERTRDSNR